MFHRYRTIFGALLLAACGTARADAPGELEHELQAMLDREHIRGLLDCYGTGHDLIFAELGGAHSAALSELRQCHTEDLITNVYLFDTTTPVARLENLEAFVGFVDEFARMNGYSSARNVPGNIRIHITSATSARVTSSTSAPHFLTDGAAGGEDRGTIDVVSARYADTVVRQPDGTWRTVERDLIVEQIWRGEGGYPFAAP